MTVYFAEEIGTGRIKIGYTAGDNPQRDRIDGAMTMSSHEVEVRAVLPGADETIEKELHEAFAASRVTRRDGRGTEFFHPGPALWSLIGFVVENKALPCEPSKCAAVKWIPGGEQKRATVAFATVQEEPRLPGVTYRGKRVERTSSNVLEILRHHEDWGRDMFDLYVSPYGPDYYVPGANNYITTRGNAILSSPKTLYDQDYMAIVNWLAREYRIQVPIKWVRSAVEFLVTEFRANLQAASKSRLVGARS